MSNTLSVIKKQDFIQVLDRAGLETRLNEYAPSEKLSGHSAAGDSAESTEVALKFEAFGLPVGSASLSTMKMPPLTEMAPEALADLSPLSGVNDGYFFPSVILPSGTLPAAPTGYFFVERARYPRYFLDLDQTFEDFLATKSSKTRSTLRRKLRKFEEVSGGKVDWRIYRDPEELAEFHALAIDLARRTYQARLYDAALPDDDEFYEEMLELAGRGRVAAFLLFLDGKPIAYLYAPIVDRSVIYGYLGFDADYASLSPGTVLQLRVMEWCFEQPDFDLFDFTEGGGAHKALYSSYSLPCSDLFLLRNRIRLRAVVALYDMSRMFSRACKGLLDRLGLRVRVRQWIHRVGLHRPSCRLWLSGR